MATCPTVKVQHEDGYMIINESDFDKKKQKLYSEPKETAAQKKKREAAEAKTDDAAE